MVEKVNLYMVGPAGKICFPVRDDSASAHNLINNNYLLCYWGLKSIQVTYWLLLLLHYYDCAYKQSMLSKRIFELNNQNSHILHVH